LQSKKAKDCKKEGALKEVVGKDMRKLHRAVMTRVKDFQQLYDMVKNQRNRFVNLLQAARQGIAEMHEKQKILANELAILRTESNKKDTELVEKHSELQRSVSERNGMRSKLNRLGRDFRGRRDKVDEQIAEIDKLNAIINTAEKDMLRLKKQYEACHSHHACCPQPSLHTFTYFYFPSHHHGLPACTVEHSGMLGSPSCEQLVMLSVLL
jgi:chromosome segregation ATPase